MTADRNLVINETIECMNMANSNIMWYQYTSDDMYTITLYCHTHIGDGDLNCTVTLNATINSGVCNNENDCANCDNCNCEEACEEASETKTSSQEPTPTVTPKDEEDETVTTSSEPSQSDCSYESTTVAALGAVVGLLIALLALMFMILIWACWAMKKRQGVNISRKDR